MESGAYVRGKNIENQRSRKQNEGEREIATSRDVRREANLIRVVVRSGRSTVRAIIPAIFPDTYDGMLGTTRMYDTPTGSNKPTFPAICISLPLE